MLQNGMQGPVCENSVTIEIQAKVANFPNFPAKLSN